MPVRGRSRFAIGSQVSVRRAVTVGALICGNILPPAGAQDGFNRGRQPAHLVVAPLPLASVCPASPAIARTGFARREYDPHSPVEG